MCLNTYDFRSDFYDETVSRDDKIVCSKTTVICCYGVLCLWQRLNKYDLFNYFAVSESVFWFLCIFITIVSLVVSASAVWKESSTNDLVCVKWGVNLYLFWKDGI